MDGGRRAVSIESCSESSDLITNGRRAYGMPWMEDWTDGVLFGQRLQSKAVSNTQRRPNPRPLVLDCKQAMVLRGARGAMGLGASASLVRAV